MFCVYLMTEKYLIFLSRFNNDYQQQLELDAKLLRYVQNMRMSFYGSNTVRDQLSHRASSKRIDEDHHYSEPAGSDEVWKALHSFLPFPSASFSYYDATLGHNQRLNADVDTAPWTSVSVANQLLC
jgi:hypothetical protein